MSRFLGRHRIVTNIIQTPAIRRSGSTSVLDAAQPYSWTSKDFQTRLDFAAAPSIIQTGLNDTPKNAGIFLRVRRKQVCYCRLELRPIPNTHYELMVRRIKPLFWRMPWWFPRRQSECALLTQSRQGPLRWEAHSGFAIRLRHARHGEEAREAQFAIPLGPTFWKCRRTWVNSYPWLRGIGP